MKNLKIFALLSFATLLISCEKDDALEAQPTEVKVTYWIDLNGEVQLDEVRFLDENGHLQSIVSPSPDWRHEMTVQQGFIAGMELLGHLPEGNNRVYARFKGAGYGCWLASEFTEVPGKFHLKKRYRMGGD